MKRLVFYGACIALSFAGALASADRHHWWKLAFDVLCIIVLVGACGTTMREARAQHHRDMLKAFDLGRSSIVREQIEMARRGEAMSTSKPLFGTPVGPWFRWYAWRPVQTADRGWRWLIFVWRRRYQSKLDLPGPIDQWFHTVVVRGQR